MTLRKENAKLRERLINVREDLIKARKELYIRDEEINRLKKYELSD